MVTYDMSKDKPENTLDLLVWRARTIEKYAQVEQALSMLFADLLGTTPEIAGIVFFRITSAHSRNIIIQDLLVSRYGKTYEPYWHGIPETPNKRGLMNLIKRLDQTRNEIVHWHTATTVSVENGKAKSVVTLIKPNVWAFKSESPQITVQNMEDFFALANFVDRSIVIFTMTATDALPEDSPAKTTWREICQRPCTFPIPDTHPLSPKPEAHENPPPQSQA